MKTSSLVVLLFSSLACAQNNRTLQVAGPVAVGQTASFTLHHPTAAAGNGYLFVYSAPQYPGVQSLQIPGFTVQGLVRIDPANFQELFFGALDGSGQVTRSVGVPNDPLLVGLAFDLQAVDLAFATNTITFSDNELSLGISDVMPNLVAIPAGTFAMGSSIGSIQGDGVTPYFAFTNERPVHPVTISRPFWIGRFEVSQADYQVVMGSNPSVFPGPQRPVENVLWSDAVAYCNAVNAQETAAGRVPAGYQYRLPTEAEWEYCCRAGTTSEFSSGASLFCADANMDRSLHAGSTCASQQTRTIGSYAPNALGLYDMHGNVWEWCIDSWDGSTAHAAGAAVDPRGTVGVLRVIRGGSWFDTSAGCRSAVRGSGSPTSAYGNVGFRIVLAPTLAP